MPVGAEPGGPTLVSELVDAGHEVLLPVVPPERGPLEWARFDGTFARGPLGLREPAGERLGVEAIGTAALVLVPGLAVDRRGIRLGRGAGYYDRSLPFARGPLVMLLHDDELVERLPAEPHDHPVTAALLPKAGLGCDPAVDRAMCAVEDRVTVARYAGTLSLRVPASGGTVPTYQYACTECDHRFDAVQSFSDPSLTVCPECGGKLRKVFSSVGDRLQGQWVLPHRQPSGAGSAVREGGVGLRGLGLDVHGDEDREEGR